MGIRNPCTFSYKSTVILVDYYHIHLVLISLVGFEGNSSQCCRLGICDNNMRVLDPLRILYSQGSTAQLILE